MYLAVSYWNGNAVAALNIAEERKIRVVLDVNSGGTSPRALEELIELLGDDVRVHVDLHAKIYATRTLALVGSANASKPGLHLDDRGHAEAAVRLKGDAARQAFDLAKRLFNSGVPATDAHVQICRERFGRRTLCEAEAGEIQRLPFFRSLCEQPDLFRHVPFIVTNEQIDDEEIDREWHNQRDQIDPKLHRQEYGYHSWGVFGAELDRRYRDQTCLTLHAGPRGALWLGLVRPPLHIYGNFTFTPRVDWRQIAGLNFHGVGARRLGNAEYERDALIAAIGDLVDKNFVLGHDFIEALNAHL